MSLRKSVLLVLGLWVSFTLRLGAAEEGEDSAEGLPENYAKNYFIAKSTMSPDKKFAVIYPTLDFSESKEAKDFLVALEPFRVLGALPTENPYFEHRSHGGLTAQWSKDASVALIKLESKWGPGDVFVVEMSDGKIKRTTDILAQVTQVLMPKFRAAMPKKKKSDDDDNQFLLEPGDDYEPCTLAGGKAVLIHLLATNDPKGGSQHPWKMRVKAEWDIAAAKFSSLKMTKESRN